jgi:hypothetical protein
MFITVILWFACVVPGVYLEENMLYHPSPSGRKEPKGKIKEKWKVPGRNICKR